MAGQQSDDTPQARRTARISAAQAVVKGNKRLGRPTHPAVEALAEAAVHVSRPDGQRRVAS